MAQEATQAASGLTKLTQREQEFLVAIFQSTVKKDGLKVNYSEIIEKLGLSSLQSAYSLNCSIKKKLLGTTETEFKGNTPKKRTRDVSTTPTQKKRAKKGSASKATQMKEEGGTDDEEEEE